MITKDNIAEVLKHNRWEGSLISDKTIHVRDGESNTMGIVYFSHPNWLQSIELLTGKLKPLPEPNPLIGKWIKCIMDSDFCTGNTWYMVNDKGIINDRICVCNPDKHISFILSKDYFNLTDIRDYNPEEEILLKVGDKIDLIDYTTDTNKGHVITKIDYFTREIYLYNRPKECCIYLRFDSAHKIESVNGRQGKFVIPPFDFEQTLLDGGFKKHGKYICLGSFSDTPLWFDTQYSEINDSVRIKLTPANAKRMIDAKAILNDLELAE